MVASSVAPCGLTSTISPLPQAVERSSSEELMPENGQRVAVFKKRET